MSLFGREATLKWGGKEYKLTVTMETIDKVESSGINILQTAVDLDSGLIPKLSQLSKLYHVLLLCAGCKVSVEEVYESMASDSLLGDFEIIKSARMAILLFFPQIEGAERADKTEKKGEE